MRIHWQDTMAFVIDYQEKLIPVMDKRAILIKNTEILIKGLKELHIPIIATQQYTKGLGESIREIKSILGEDVYYLDKITFSVAEDENILKEIKKRNVKNIIICGIEAHICVLQSVIDLIEMGYHVILVVDCISSRKELDKQYGIERAKIEGAVLTTYEAILFELLRTAKNEKFKSISQLIK